jgi:hypothetical protein
MMVPMLMMMPNMMPVMMMKAMMMMSVMMIIVGLYVRIANNWTIIAIIMFSPDNSNNRRKVDKYSMRIIIRVADAQV